MAILMGGGPALMHAGLVLDALKEFRGGNLMYDVIIIGAGPAGYVSAIRLSQLGKKSGNN